MNNTEKKLDALIEALGFDIAESPARTREDFAWASGEKGTMETLTPNYKLTKRNNKYKMAYTNLRNQIQLHIDNECLMALTDIDLRAQIKLCEEYISEQHYKVDQLWGV